MADRQPAGRMGQRGLRDVAGGAQGVQRAVAEEAVRRWLDLRDVAEGVRRQGPHHDAGRRPGRGVRQGQGADARRLLRRHVGRSDHPAMGHRGAEEGVPAADPQRIDAVVSGLQRAELGVRLGVAVHQRRARRRRMGDQRSEGLDNRRASRRLLLLADPHRPRVAEAQRHLVSARTDAPAGRRGARHHPARRYG